MEKEHSKFFENSTEKTETEKRKEILLAEREKAELAGDQKRLAEIDLELEAIEQGVADFDLQ
ncbi:hypothetical protein KKD04_02240 [Patescibacteria group bacterium]|nr:hypothetical protein [Patescibacteria group bacterium]